MIDVVLNMDMIGRMLDILQQGIEFFPSIGIDIHFIILGKKSLVIDKMHINIVFVCGAIRISKREGPIFDCLDLFSNFFFNTDLFLIWPVKHFLPGKILIENEVENESDNRKKHQNHKPGPRRTRTLPLEKNDGERENDVYEK